MENKILIRILLSPFIFIYSIFFTAAMCFFPMPIIIGFSLYNLITQPFVYLIKKGGTEIKYSESFFNECDNKLFKNYLFANITGVLLPILLPFIITIIYIKNGKIITDEYR